MLETNFRSAIPLVSAQYDKTEPATRVVTLALEERGYTCSVCGSAWAYQQVRNTGRCPSCGSGLVRDPEWA